MLTFRTFDFRISSIVISKLSHLCFITFDHQDALYILAFLQLLDIACRKILFRSYFIGRFQWYIINREIRFHVSTNMNWNWWQRNNERNDSSIMHVVYWGRQHKFAVFSASLSNAFIAIEFHFHFNWMPFFHIFFF